MLDRDAWFLGPVFVLLWLIAGAIYLGGPEIDAIADAVATAVEGVRLTEQDIVGRRGGGVDER